MPVTKNRIEKNLQEIRLSVAEACDRSGRRPSAVAIVAVTKAVDCETVRNLIDAGVTDLGENRAGQLVERSEEIDGWLRRRRTKQPAPIRWHMIGHLQRNKVKAVLPAAPMIHSVDSLRLAEEINSRCEREDKVTDVLLQVNCSQEPQKHGVAVGAAAYLGELIASMRHVRLVGLMTMAAMVPDAEQARPTFTRLRELYEEMRHEGVGGDGFRHLSMGMSQDYTVAVEEGATILRIGSALFEQP